MLRRPRPAIPHHTARMRAARDKGVSRSRDAHQKKTRVHARTHNRPAIARARAHRLQRSDHGNGVHGGPRARAQRQERHAAVRELRGGEQRVFRLHGRRAGYRLLRTARRTARTCVHAKYQIPNTEYTCDTGQTRNKLLEQCARDVRGAYKSTYRPARSPARMPQGRGRGARSRT